MTGAPERGRHPVDMADCVELRWVPVDTGADADARPSGVTRHALLNTMTAVSAAAGLLHQRWDDLTVEQRRDLAATLHHRAEELRRLLSSAAG